MFLDQQLIIQQAVKIISRLPACASWMLTATNEDGVARPDGTPVTQASLNITVARGIVPMALSLLGPMEGISDTVEGRDLWWRTDGNLEITLDVEDE